MDELDALKEYVNNPPVSGGQLGAIAFRDLGAGRGLWIYPMMFTFKLVIGRIGADTYEDGWCYRREYMADFIRVFAAMNAWDPAQEKEPEGWVRHPPTGRRRFPDGDPETEEVHV